MEINKEIESKRNLIERLKETKKQQKDRHLEIYLGKTYMDMNLVKFDDKPITEKDNKNEIIDLVIDTIIRYLEGGKNENQYRNKI